MRRARFARDGVESEKRVFDDEDTASNERDDEGRLTSKMEVRSRAGVCRLLSACQGFTSPDGGNNVSQKYKKSYNTVL